MKTPEKIKRGLECDSCADCPWSGEDGCLWSEDFALAYIQQLEQDNAQKDERIRNLVRELAAAMNAIQSRRSCIDCKHSKIIPDGNWVWTDCPKRDGRCCDKSLWEWRGVEEDEA